MFQLRPSAADKPRKLYRLGDLVLAVKGLKSLGDV